MLMIKDNFEQQLKARIASLPDKYSDETILNVYRAFKQMRNNIWTNDDEIDPLGRVEVTLPDGVKYPLYLALSEVVIEDYVTADQVKPTALKFVEEALYTLKEANIKTLEKSEQTDITDLKALINLVGLGFEQLAQELKPRLVGSEVLTAEEGNFKMRRYVPDKIARIYVLQLMELAKEIKITENYALAEQQYLDIVLLPLELYAGIASATRPYRAAKVLTLLDEYFTIKGVSNYIFNDIPAYNDSYAEYYFALGASNIIGTSRLLRAEDARQSTFGLVFNGITTATGAFSTGLGLWSYGRNLKYLKTTEKLLPRLEAGRAKALKQLNDYEKFQVDKFVKDAVELLEYSKGSSKYLSNSQKRVLRTYGYKFNDLGEVKTATNLSRGDLNTGEIVSAGEIPPSSADNGIANSGSLGLGGDELPSLPDGNLTPNEIKNEFTLPDDFSLEPEIKTPNTTEPNILPEDEVFSLPDDFSLEPPIKTPASSEPSNLPSGESFTLPDSYTLESPIKNPSSPEPSKLPGEEIFTLPDEYTMVDLGNTKEMEAVRLYFDELGTEIKASNLADIKMLTYAEMIDQKGLEKLKFEPRYCRLKSKCKQASQSSKKC